MSYSCTPTGTGTTFKTREAKLVSCLQHLPVHVSNVFNGPVLISATVAATAAVRFSSSSSMTCRLSGSRAQHFAPASAGLSDQICHLHALDVDLQSNCFRPFSKSCGPLGQLTSFAVGQREAAASSASASASLPLSISLKLIDRKEREGEKAVASLASCARVTQI